MYKQNLIEYYLKNIPFSSVFLFFYGVMELTLKIGLIVTEETALWFLF